MPKPIKILYTTSNFDTAGSGKVIYDLVKHLDKDKFEVAIACKSDEGPYFEMIKSLGVPVHIFSTTTNYRSYLTLPKRIRKIASFYKHIDVDIIHSWHWSSNWTEALAAKIAGIKYVYTKKSMGYSSKHWRIKTRLSSFLIMVNQDMESLFENKISKELIPFGIDTEYYNPKLKKESKQEVFKICTVANLVPVKGIEFLIKALSHLDNIRVLLTIVGKDDTKYAKTLKTMVETMTLTSQVEFVGKKLDVRTYFANADLYVIPTKHRGEGMPMALVEAMSMGIPSIGSEVPGIKYVLKNFPELLFLAEDSAALAEKISWIISMDTEDLNKIGQELRNYCVKNFSMDKFIEAHQSLYERLVR